MALYVFFLVVPLASRAEAPCSHEVILQYSKKLEEIARIKSSWAPSRFTDPHKHDPGNFLYVIRVDNTKEVPYGMDRVAAEAEWARKMHRNHPLISASVIAPGYTGSFMSRNWAYILKVPEDSVIASTPKDSGISSMASNRRGDPQKMAASLGPYYGLHEPKHLIDHSIEYANTYKGSGEYNEVFLMGEAGGQKVEVVGIAYFPGRKGRYGEATDKDFLEALSNKLGVPLVEIP